MHAVTAVPLDSHERLEQRRSDVEGEGSDERRSDVYHGDSRGSGLTEASSLLGYAALSDNSGTELTRAC